MGLGHGLQNQHVDLRRHGAEQAKEASLCTGKTNNPEVRAHTPLRQNTVAGHKPLDTFREVQHCKVYRGGGIHRNCPIINRRNCPIIHSRTCPVKETLMVERGGGLEKKS